MALASSSSGEPLDAAGPTDSPASPNRIVIVGGGMAGLVAALEILDRARARGSAPAPEVVVLEAASRPGGNVRTERDAEAGFLVEWGPEGFLDSVPETLDLVRRLGLEPRLIRGNTKARHRYIQREGRLRRVPVGPPAFLLSDILPLGKRLRVFLEPFMPGPSDPARDETVFEFASRRIGRGAAEILVDAMVSGVFAGDSRALSLRSAFPKMYAMERRHGCLVKALIARKLEAFRTGAKTGGPSGPAGVITSFRDGMEELVEGLARAVGRERIRLDASVAEIVPADSGGDAVHGGGSGVGARGFGGVGRRRCLVVLKSGERLAADAVVVAAPSWAAAPLFRRTHPELARALGEIPVASIAVVAAGHRREAVAHPLDGFGYLIPRSEGRRTLGVLWSESTFPGSGRAPRGHVLLRAMIGGALDPEAVTLDDAALLDLLAREVHPVLGVRGAPVWTRVFRFAHGIPQYNVGHAGILERLGGAVASWPNLYLTGTSYRGIAVNSTCQQGPKLAEALLQALGGTSASDTPPERLF